MLDSEVERFLQVIQMRLGQARREAGLTQEETADRAALPVRTYQGLEGIRGRRRFNPTILTLYAVSKAVNLELEKLIEQPSLEEIQILENILEVTISSQAKTISDEGINGETVRLES
jgi:transcriptional regulator with XRE-family HTH domain